MEMARDCEGVRGWSDRRMLYKVLVSYCPLLCSRVWNTLTDNYGNVMAVDWKTSHTRSLHLPILNLTEQEVYPSYKPHCRVRSSVIGFHVTSFSE